MTTTRRSFMRATTLGGLASILITACASRGQQPVGEYVDDAATTTRVKTRLAEDNLIGAFVLHVETLAGVAALRGTVRTPQESARAEQLARETYGVKGVRNEIVVRP